VQQEWHTGVPLEAIGRKYAVNAAHMYRWKGSLDQGLKEPGELGRKALKADVVKNTFARKGLT
jgi:hypothetical protein